MSTSFRSRRCVALSIAIAHATTAATFAGLDAAPAVNPANGHTYYLLPTSKWTIAERKAISLGGHLVTVDDAAENAWVASQFSTAGGVNRSLWIGLNYANTTDQFVWTSGAANNPTFNDTQFATNEPNDLNGIERYIHIIGPSWVGSTQIGKWNDAPDITAFNINAPGGGRAYGAMYGVVEVNAPVAPPTPASAADGTWGVNGDGFWHDTTKWAGGLVPNGVGAVARLKRAVSGTSRIVYVNSPQTIGTLVTGDTDGGTAPQWYITGTRAMTLATAGAAQPELLGEVAFTHLETELAGTQGFAKTGMGITILWDANPNLSGPIAVQAGVLRVVSPQGLGTEAGEVRVAAGAQIGFYPQFAATIGDRITLNGDGPASDLSGALRLTAFSNMESTTLTVPEIVLETAARISVEDDSTGRLAVTKLSGPGNLVKTQLGKLDLLSTDNGTFTGKIRFAVWSTALNTLAGEIVVRAEGSLGPNPATFQPSQVLFDYGGAIETTTTQTFDDANRGFLVGDGSGPTGQIDGGGFAPASGTVLTVANTIAGIGMLRKLGAGELRLTGSLAGFSGQITGVAGLLTAVSPLEINRMDVEAGAKVRLQGTGVAGFAGWQIRTLNISPRAGATAAGLLELASAGIRLDYDPVVSSPEDGIRTMLADGRITGGTTATGGTRIGYGEVRELGITSFLGVPVDDSTVIIFRTLGGDADLNGTVAFADLLALAQHYGAAGKWTTGDFSYDGLVDFTDLLTLAQNYGASAASLDQAKAFAQERGGTFASDWVLARSLVPEPTASIGMVSMLVAAGTRRRRPTGAGAPHASR